MPSSTDPGGRAARLLTALLAATLLGTFVFVVARKGQEPPPEVLTQDATIDVPAALGSKDAVQLETTLYLPQVSRRSPAVLLPHGFGGNKDSVARDARELAERGFIVLAYSARGFGSSTGMIGLNDPDQEVNDAKLLLDYLARQPGVALDSPSDPKVAVTGASYAGALALLLAGHDPRVDAIAPVMTYNNLTQGLLPNAATARIPNGATPAEGVFSVDGVFKKAWAGNLFAGGQGRQARGGPGPDAPEPGTDPDEGGQEALNSAASASESGSAPAGQGAGIAPSASDGARANGPCGRFSPEVCQAYTELATTGRASYQTAALLSRVSPASVTGKITVPTLLVQGEQDTLFGLDQADANARQIAEAGGKVQVVWYAGGHDGGGPGPQLRGKIADWLTHHLTGEGTDPLPGFSYDIQGAFQATRAPSVRIVQADRYPGLDGKPTPRQAVRLMGEEQTIVNPPGGNPAAVSGIPGAGSMVGRSSSLTSLLGIDLPGQSAQFVSPEFTDQVVVTGSSTVRLQVSALPTGTAAPSETVLFVKLYTIGPDGRRTLPGSAVAPVRLRSLPSDGTPVEVTVSLPGIVRPVDAGHRLQLVVATTDQAYTNATEPASYRVALAGNHALSVPVVSGEAASAGWPIGQVLGIAGVVLAALAIALAGAFRRRRSRNFDPALASTPLVIDGLTKAYPGGLTAVSDLSFRVERGQVLGLLGPNGAGKTTTLRMLMGLITPTSGEIRVFGHRARPGAPVLSRIGCFVEGSGFLPHLSGKANLELHWAATGRPAAKAHFTEALEIAGLGTAINRKVRTYSQGMRQRLAIAQAMLGLPELLVLDEPTNGLDPPQIHQMREVLRRYAATGRTVLVSSHLLAEVEQTSTHVVVMHRGRVVADGAVGEIVAAGGEATFLVDEPSLAAEALRTIEGVSDVDTDGRTVHANLDTMPRSIAVAVLVQAGVAVEQAGPRRRLEDAFLQLVGEEAEK